MGSYSEARIINRRTYPRYHYRAGINIKSTNGETYYTWDPGISQNLSLDGISILHSKILVPGEIVFLAIPLFGSEREILLSGSVEWVAVDDLYDDSPYWVKAGIMFSDMSKDKRQTLAKTLLNRPVENYLSSKKAARKIDFVM